MSLSLHMVNKKIITGSASSKIYKIIHLKNAFIDVPSKMPLNINITIIQFHGITIIIILALYWLAI